MLCSEKFYDSISKDKNNNYEYLPGIYAHGKLEQVLETDALYGDAISHFEIMHLDDYDDDNRKIYRTECIDSNGVEHNVICFSWLYISGGKIHVHGLVISEDEDDDIIKFVIEKYCNRESIL